MRHLCLLAQGMEDITALIIRMLDEELLQVLLFLIKRCCMVEF